MNEVIKRRYWFDDKDNIADNVVPSLRQVRQDGLAEFMCGFNQFDPEEDHAYFGIELDFKDEAAEKVWESLVPISTKLIDALKDITDQEEYTKVYWSTMRDGLMRWKNDTDFDEVTNALYRLTIPTEGESE